MRFDLAIKHGTIVEPRGRYQAHVYVRAGRIAAVGSLEESAARTIDASGLFLLPGVVDGHVHFMDPAATEREDFMTGSGAAAVGGTTTVIEHTHAGPLLNAAAVGEKAEYLADRSVVDYGLIAHVWPDMIDQTPAIWRAGASAFKVFTCETHGVPAILPGDMLRLFREVAGFGGLCLVHCEDEFITADNERRLKTAGRTDPMVIPEWRTREAESVAVNTVAILSRLTGARAIIAHASRPEVLDLVKRERRLGGRLWVESCPQYLYLEESEIQTHGALRKFTPPARSADEADRMWERLQRGEITHIQTDHAPSTRAQKAEGGGDIWKPHFGLPGVETTLTMMLNGVNQGRLTLERLVDVLSETPARLHGLYPTKGCLRVGADADVVVVDLERVQVLSDDQVISKAGWTPYAGLKVKGGPVMTFLRGQLVAENGRATAPPGTGRWVRRQGEG
jgi:dihydroorotase (multifunctional complex type)